MVVNLKYDPIQFYKAQNCGGNGVAGFGPINDDAHYFKGWRRYVGLTTGLIKPKQYKCIK